VKPVAGCQDLEEALAKYRRTGAASEQPYFLVLYADAARIAGLNEVGRNALDEARRLITSRPSFIEPEIDRLAAAFLLSADADSVAAEQHLRAVVAAAQNRDALALELRVAADLRAGTHQRGNWRCGEPVAICGRAVYRGPWAAGPA
jgi:hypothetical protein